MTRFAFGLIALISSVCGAGEFGAGILKEAGTIPERAKAVRERENPPGSGDAVIDEVRRRFAKAPAFNPKSSADRKRAAAILTKGPWRCKAHRAADWSRFDERAYVYARYPDPERSDKMFMEFEQGAGDGQGRPYQVVAGGLAGYSGFALLRVLDESNLVKELIGGFSEAYALPSISDPSQAAQLYIVCSSLPR